MCPSDEKLNQGSSTFSRASASNHNAHTDKAKYKLCTLPKRLTCAALVDRQLRETEITDFMVRRACDEIDCLQQFPFAPG